ncbi:Endonuclease/exonuclease/phosphatase, partial [Jimgerdemannia flammicorona]
VQKCQPRRRKTPSELLAATTGTDLGPANSRLHALLNGVAWNVTLRNGSTVGVIVSATATVTTTATTTATATVARRLKEVTMIGNLIVVIVTAALPHLHDVRHLRGGTTTTGNLIVTATAAHRLTARARALHGEIRTTFGTATTTITVINRHQLHLLYKSPQTQYRTTEKKFSQSSSNNDTITREWAAIAAASQADLANFKVTCYNILADSCFQKTLGLYKHHSLPDLAWQYRWPVILRELQALQSDIYFIQEMDIVPYKNQALPAFQEMGYEGLYKKRLPAPPDVPVADDGCALFVKRNRFEIESFKLVDYQERGKYLSKGNVGIVAILREVTVNPPPRICVGNTHLYYNRNRGIMKLGQLDILFKAIEEELRGRVMPIIICGDMNSTPGSIVDTFIRTGYVDMSAIDEQYISGQVKDRSTATTAGQRTATSSYYSSAFTWTSSIPANPGQSTAEPVPPGSYIPTLLPPPSATSLTPLLIPITRSAMVLNREAIWQFRNKLPVNSHNYSSDVADPDPILTHPFVFNSVYSYDDPALYTTNNSGAEKRGVACDFIYVGGWRNPMSVSAAPAVVNVATKEGSDHRYEVQPVARLDIPVQQLNGLKLPNMKREIASDHIPLAAEFAFMKV